MADYLSGIEQTGGGVPDAHAPSHTNGSDDIQNATAAQKGVATAAQITKLDGMETGATADQTGAEIKTAYEGEADTNAFTDAEQTKLGGIATSANNYIHPNHSGDVTSVADGAQTIANDVVSNAKLADMLANTVKLRETASTGDPEDSKISALTEEAAPAAGDWLLGEETGTGNLRKFDASKLPYARIKSGAYTGDGSTSQGITGVGFSPIFLKIWQRETVDGNSIAVYCTTPDIMDDNAAGGVADVPNGKFETNKIISLDTDGFTVDDAGADDHPNTSGQIYNYMAIG